LQQKAQMYYFYGGIMVPGKQGTVALVTGTYEILLRYKTF